MNLPPPPAREMHDHLCGRNTRYLTPGALISLAAYIAFGVLDFFTFESNNLVIVLAIRAVCVGVLAFGSIASIVRKEWTARWIEVISVGTTIISGWGIALMAWLDDGFESPYYAGICLVVLASGFLFTWSPRRNAQVALAIYLFYMAPLPFGAFPVEDPVAVVSNQFFLLSTLIIAVLMQWARYKMEEQEVALKVRLEDLASTDELTRVLNRRYFFLFAEEELGRARRYHRDLSAILIDIDHFKSINDEFGHAVGDEVLRAVAARLKAAIRAQDVIGRYGGEEFAVLAPETGLEATSIIGHRICTSVAAMEIPTSRGVRRVTVSVGVATLKEGVPNVSALLDRSDTALYEAKRGGRNRVVLAD